MATKEVVELRARVSLLKDEIVLLKSEINTMREQTASDVKILIEQVDGLGKYIKENVG